MSIAGKIQAYHDGMSGPHHRYRSWEHCYRYFHSKPPAAIASECDQAALQLGFYLASWGMYRGSGFLLQHSYTVHLGVIDCLVSSQFTILWGREIGTGDDDAKLVPHILKAIDGVRDAYKPFAPPTQASDILVTKVLLGTFGCLPACDRFFIGGFKSEGLKFSYLNETFVRCVLDFCREHRPELYAEQRNILRLGGMHYPLMKLVDMYFWQTGYDRADSTKRDEHATAF